MAPANLTCGLHPHSLPLDPGAPFKLRPEDSVSLWVVLGVWVSSLGAAMAGYRACWCKAWLISGLISDLLYPCGPVRSSLDCVWPWLPSPELQIDFVTQPCPCLVATSSPDDLDFWLLPVALPGPALLTLLGNCGTGPWMVRLLPCCLCYCAHLPTLCPSGTASPCYSMTCPYLCSGSMLTNWQSASLYTEVYL